MSIYVGNLPYDLTKEEFEQAFSRFGKCTATIAKKMIRGEKKSSGYGFIDFENERDRENCLNTFPRTLVIKGRQVEFREARPRHVQTCDDTAFITGLGPEHDQDFLESLFSSYNPIEVMLIKPCDGPIPGFGYAKFQTSEERDVAIAQLNGKVCDGCKLLVRIADRPFTKNPPRRHY